MSETANEYNLPGVLHYLQAEWRKFEREKNEWAIERAELQVLDNYFINPLVSYNMHIGSNCSLRRRKKGNRKYKADFNKKSQNVGICYKTRKVKECN